MSDPSTHSTPSSSPEAVSAGVDNSTKETDMSDVRQARYVVRKADHVGGAPIPDDEPVLVIRAQDVLALDIMDEYLNRYRHGDEVDPLVLSELEDHRADLVRWQDTHGVKWADR